MTASVMDVSLLPPRAGHRQATSLLNVRLCLILQQFLLFSVFVRAFLPAIIRFPIRLHHSIPGCSASVFLFFPSKLGISSWLC
ncbi:hypothetical protein F5Y15DRAFT_616 [Xylariaceae sp. FL0016]|nr:hypothetical protein F5Y15DRAFT_616 [Xylariaceae sp. FL0016]